MASLPDELFGLVERKVLEARSTAEAAAGAAINALAVNRPEPYASLSPAQRHLRVALRARARQLGGGSQIEGLPLLTEEIAYQQWHRMLFARFLAENGLLMHPSGIAVTLQDCVELAGDEGEPDAWSLAARYASAMLPGIFRQDDPVVQVRFAPEGRLTLEQILGALPAVAFTADDALGWMYQFWQSQRKKEVQGSERKIGGADIAPVTQLFTEDYMVRFLLENSLGAWWAARHPDSPLVKEFTYLRFRDDGTPAAGTFPGWPDRAAEVTCMDPCGGSGHFVVAEFGMLRRMRMEEEGLTEAEASDAVIRDNLFMLEIDPRCTQIAAFALVLAAWKAGGYREVPVPNIACSGIPVEGQLEDWVALANGSADLRATLEQLHTLFKDASDLGSLIDPRVASGQGTLFEVDFGRVAPLLDKALKRERALDPAAVVFGASAAGAAQAARILAGQYTLVATNVPYLSRGKQGTILKEFCDIHYPESGGDIATVFVERSRIFVTPGGSYVLVTPQNWLFIKTYAKLRKQLLTQQIWNMVVNLGTKAFRTPLYDFNIALVFLTNMAPIVDDVMRGLDISAAKSALQKGEYLSGSELHSVTQLGLLKNPDARITLDHTTGGTLLRNYADVYTGLQTGDNPRYQRYFWEMPKLLAGWEFQQRTATTSIPYGGRKQVLFWENGSGALIQEPQSVVRGLKARNKRGLAVHRMANQACTLYTGEIIDQNAAVIIPRDPKLLPAIWAFCKSPEYTLAVRRLDTKLGVTPATLTKVPFDLAHWKAVAEAAGPLPEPHSDDPTQWLFNGWPVGGAETLQISVGRLLGYRWPQQPPSDVLDALQDRDGIVCLPSVTGERPAVDRLRALLAVVYGVDWSLTRQEELLTAVDFAGKDLDLWLRDGFFPQHCKLFKNRPFIWHIWDGRRDGFSALVNYHKLDGANLNKLIYTYLGDWIRIQRSQRDAGEPGAEGRLVAALELQRKLEAIRDGEPPYDIYVRWKPLHEQPIGWNPDLNDGVRLNIRPFVIAGVLRSRFTINWEKDRGKNPDGSERINDLHFTAAEKLAARRQWEASQPAQSAKAGKGLY